MRESLADDVFVDVFRSGDAAAVVRREGEQRDADDVGAAAQMDRHLIVERGVEQRARPHERRHVSVPGRGGVLRI